MKISNLFGKSEPLIQDLPSMKNKIEGFAIASMSDTTIIFTGGLIKGSDDKKDEFLKSCSALDVLNNKWYEEELPDLVQARKLHSNCCIGSYVYVFAGNDGNRKRLKSIE